MWIILEGVDGSGKSTLLEVLVKKMPGTVKVGHLGPPESASTAILECLSGGIDKSDGDRLYRPGSWHLVSDRLHMGCPVYGPLYRPDLDVDGYGDFGKAGWRYMELYLASRGAVTFLVTVSPDTAIRRVKARGEENFFSVESIIETLPTLIDRYDWIATDSLTLGVRVFEPHMDELEDWASMIMAIAFSRENDVLDIAEFDDYIGTPWPKTLIVCEPIRETRLEILDAIDDSTWMEVGFCSSAHTAEDLTTLATMLDDPVIVGMGDLPIEANSFVFNANGKVVEDSIAAAAACTH